jgi:hypothetical protein
MNKNSPTDLFICESLGRMLGAVSFCGLGADDLPAEILAERLKALTKLGQEIEEQLNKKTK